MPPYVDPERRSATPTRLTALLGAGTLSPAHVRLAAKGCAVSLQTVRRWLRQQQAGTERGRQGPDPFPLSKTAWEAFA